MLLTSLLFVGFAMLGVVLYTLFFFNPDIAEPVNAEDLKQQYDVLLYVGFGVTLLFSFMAMWVASRRIINPLREITESAKAISTGEYQGEITVESHAAEFQDLSESLNKMNAHLLKDIQRWQRITRVQNEFIGNVSHEVKNPVFAVGGYLEALSTPNLNADQRRRYAEKGLGNLERLNNLFSDLIEIARLEYREDMIDQEAFNINELLEEILEIALPKAQEKGLTLDAKNTAHWVFADRNRISQVLTNLIENAIAYTDQGTVRCRIKRHQNKVRIEVVDSGRGIGDEHLDRIFDRFYRADKARSRKHGGTGLGLSIVKKILQAHGEDIEVESTPGSGSRFWFELSRAEPA